MSKFGIASGYSEVFIIPQNTLYEVPSIPPISDFYALPNSNINRVAISSGEISPIKTTNNNNVEYLRTPQKRAFDRLDVSPFDFEALSKRFNENDFFYGGRRKKTFDHVDENSFFGLMARRKRAFDRLEDGPFLLGKRQYFIDNIRPPQEYNNLLLHNVRKRPFDRLESSSFGIAKRSIKQKLSIADALNSLN